MSCDYVHQRREDGRQTEKEDDGRNKTVIGIDTENKWISAFAAQKEKFHPHALAAVAREMGSTGFNTVIQNPKRKLL